MKKLFLIILLVSGYVQAQDPSQDIQINLNIEIENLQQLSNSFASINQRLLESLEDLDIKDLQPEQIEALSQLITQLERLQQQSDTFVAGLPMQIQAMQQPADELISRSIDNLQQQAIQPTIDSIDKRVSGWINRFIIGAILLVLVIGAIAYVVFSNLRRATQAIYQLTGQYRIVHIDDIPPKEEKPQKPTSSLSSEKTD